MKKLFALLLALAMLFSLAACGSAPAAAEVTPVPADTDARPDAPGEVQEAAAFDFSGYWVCSGMRAGDTEMDGDQLLGMFGVSPDEVLSVDLTGDQAIVSLMGQGFRAGWAHSAQEEAVILSADPAMLGDGVEGLEISLNLEEDGRLSCRQPLGTLLLSRADDRPQALARQLNLYFMPGYTAEESAALANSGRECMYITDGSTFYGRLSQRSTNRSGLCSFTLSMDDNGVWPVLSEPKVLLTSTNAYYLNLVDGKLYFQRVDIAAGYASSICRMNPDGSDLETLVEDAGDYLQVVGDRMFYCSADWRYCSADLNGNHAEVLFDREVYNCYQVKPGLLMYQDDADHESLHLRDLNTGDDMRIAMGRIYGYGITGNTLFFAKIDESAELQAPNHICRLYRMDLTRPIAQYSESGELLFAYVYEVGDNIMGDSISVLPDMLYANNHAQCEPENWRSLSDDSYNTLAQMFRYRDDDWVIFENISKQGKLKGFDFTSVRTGHCTSYLCSDDIK
ncbi:MAG: DUF5050 domain-containing protein [Oscillospiraceae bacterium]|nr:DUF5050 domain-containing protein [Oscillospiraceae bacterium]